VVVDIVEIFTTGPEEATFAINELIEPATVIPSHANEMATTSALSYLERKQRASCSSSIEPMLSHR